MEGLEGEQIVFQVVTLNTDVEAHICFEFESFCF